MQPNNNPKLACDGEEAVPELQDGLTIGEVFAAAVASHGDRPFFAVPPNESRGYLPAGFEITYRDAAKQVAQLTAAYRSAGYGLGHRVATLLENRPEYVLHKLALNAVGACCVPINPDYRAGETAYLLEHSQPDLVLTLAEREAQIAEALAHSRHQPPSWCRTASPPARWCPHRARRKADRPHPRRPPASSTPPAPPDGRRAASSRRATRWRAAPGTPRSAAWRLSGPARSASTIRCRSITSTPASSR